VRSFSILVITEMGRLAFSFLWIFLAMRRALASVDAWSTREWNRRISNQFEKLALRVIVIIPYPTSTRAESQEKLLFLNRW